MLPRAQGVKGPVHGGSLCVAMDVYSCFASNDDRWQNRACWGLAAMTLIHVTDRALGMSRLRRQPPVSLLVTTVSDIIELLPTYQTAGPSATAYHKPHSQNPGYDFLRNPR